MKKLITFTFILMCALAASAQTIYTSIDKVDKFDDIVWTKQIKTIISISLGNIVVETKGQTPVEYEIYDSPLFVSRTGSRDKLANLVNDIYGYEVSYTLFPKGTLEETIKAVESEIPDSISTNDMLSSEIKLRLLAKKDEFPTITFRTISFYQQIFEYKTELAWIRYKDGSRLIYRK